MKLQMQEITWREAIERSQLDYEINGDDSYLCIEKGTVFHAHSIHLCKDHDETLESNDIGGCWYVDHYARRHVVPIHKLDAMYLITIRE